MLVYVFLLGYLAQCFAQRANPGLCPEPDAMPNFDENKLIGEWYEWARISNYYEPDNACGVITYYRGKDGYLVEHVSSIIRRSGTWIFWEGKMIPKDEQPIARYNLTFPEYSRDKVIKSTFVDANWGFWAIMHSCKQEKGQAVEFVWIWTKSPKLQQKHQDEIANALGKLNLTMQDLSIIDHDKCPNQK
ncbi:apolipoprotein D [Diachasma alloeum]|uniref:apolipoprotein D n=1 Tax=Diachasma alloeum TaxID=454923 RepID=UPI00073813C0|nr:apolipoprotein D [Diachasma alloeum]